MKTLHHSIIIISIIGLSLTINHVYAPCAENVQCSDLHPKDNTNQTQWKPFHAIGHYQDTNNPSKSDKLFIVKYQTINGTVDSIEQQYNNFLIDVSSINSGVFEIKIPRNYPYTNEPSGNSVPQNFLILANHHQILNYSETTSDCYFQFSIPFSGASKIEILSIYLAIDSAYHGDHIIDKCLSQTTFLDSPIKQFKSGIAAKDVKCKEDLQFIMKNENGQPACVTPHTFDKLIDRGWGIIPLAGLPTSH